MKILLVGGGSGGSVSPLLAVAEEIKNLHPKAKFLFVGGYKGPEKMMAAEAGIPFKAISAGKLRRYFSLSNLVSPFATIVGFAQSIRILKLFQPNCIFGSGSFVQVPVVWAAWFLKIPVVLHQQDLLPSLANTLCQIPAKKITVSFEDSLTRFASGLGLFYRKRRTEKLILTGNPFRSELAQATKEQGLSFFKLKKDFPTLLVLGGGTGAAFLNNLIADCLPDLAKTIQIIHATGKDKLKNNYNNNYHPFEFISEMGKAYAAADIVLCRAGLSTITELSNLRKLSIIVPMPNSHQEINAFLLDSLKAAIVLPQNRLIAGNFTYLIRKLLFEHKLSEKMRENIAKIMLKNSGKKIAEIIIKLAES